MTTSVKTVQDVGETAQAEWNTMLGEYAQAYPELANEFQAAMNGQLPEGWEQNLPTYELGSKAATRNSSGAVINAIAESVPSFFGGSADLAGSNKTYMNNEKTLQEMITAVKTFGTVYVSSQWVQQ